MKLIKAITITTVGFWCVQFIVYGLFLAGWFFNLFMRFIVCLGVALPERVSFDFLHQVLLWLTCPIRWLWPGAWSDGGSFKVFLLMIVNSLVWGAGLGTLAWLLGKICRKPRPETSAK